MHRRIRMGRITWTGCLVLTIGLTACTEAGIRDEFGSTGSSTFTDNAGVINQPSAGVCRGTGLRCYAQVRTDQTGHIQSFATTQGFGPSDLASAYQLTTSVSPGATIAIVDAYGYSNAESDLATYRSNYGLPACSVASGCLTIVNQNGQTSPLPPDPSAGDDWTVETALDLQMASAACPNCKLLLVQAQDDSSDGLYIANNAAASLGATVISNSWGGPDDGTGSQYETYFNHAGVGEFVASGDNGYDDGNSGPDYPSTSAYVTAVGGTTLTQATTTTRGWTETAWSSGGSSCSTEIPTPSWQAGVSTSCSFRAASDTAAVGDPNTGVAVYNNGPSSSGWIVVGGTSVASPFTAAVMALTGHGPAGPSFIYSNTSDFYDVTSGSNGSCGAPLCTAGAGWDGPTGWGTPNGSALAGSSCTPNCSGKQCGANGCGGSCGTCPSGESCNSSSQCVSSCTPNCSGKQCGSDGCGGSCGTCPSGESCNSSGQCVSTCTPNCSGKQCGTDGCGGSCGTCPSGESCNSSGQCVSSCTPNCSGKQCGADGCGGSCGTCPSGESCNSSGQCVSSCTPNCSGKQCGSDGCGGSCGTCGSGQTCNSSGQCVSSGGSCSHSDCSTGKALKSGCNACVTNICASDPYCCRVRWDSICVGEVGSICGQSCGGGGGGVTVTIASPQNGAVFTSGSSFEIIANATSSAGSITSATLNWTSASGTNNYAMSPNGQGSWVIGGTLGATGSRTYSVTATDSAGNTATSATQTLSVQ
jgi:hypothetical protein